VVNAGSERVGIIDQQLSSYSTISGFVGYRRIHQADVALQIETGSPVNIEVTDPDGFSLTSESAIASDEEYIREIPSELYYFELEQGHDGQPVDRILSPTLKEGDYIIKVLPSPEASPTDTYSLKITTEAGAVMVVDSQAITDIPIQGFALNVNDGEIEVVENDTSTPEELFSSLKILIKETPIKSRFLKKRLLFKVRVAKYWYKHDRVRRSAKTLKNLKRLVKRRSGRGIPVETADELEVIVDELITSVKS
jgi:acylphosphatase